MKVGELLEDVKEVLSRKTKHKTHVKYSQFSSCLILLSYTVAANADLENNKTTAPRGNTGLGSCERLGTTSVSTRQYIILLYLCVSF